MRVFCLASDKEVFSISQKNHRYYCHKNNIAYEYSSKVSDLAKNIHKYRKTLYITENILFPNNLDFIHSTENESILTIFMDPTIDSNFFLVSSCCSGIRFVHQYIRNRNIPAIFSNNGISLSDIFEYKGISKFSYATKINYNTYITYSYFKTSTSILDLSDLKKSKNTIMINLNRDMGII